MKTCSRCKETKPYDEFHNRSMSLDGKDGQCKICRNKTCYAQTGLQDAPERDRIPAVKVLEALGYDTSSHVSVNQQFLQRWGPSIDSSIENNKYRGLEDEDTQV